jgi:hypothetical protein
MFLKKKDVCVHLIKLAHDKKPVAIRQFSLFDNWNYSATHGSVRLVRFYAVRVWILLLPKIH